MADAVREILEISRSQIEPPPRLGTRLKIEFIHGMGKVDEQFMILLNMDRAFNGDELTCVKEAGQSKLTEEKLEVGKV